MIEFSTLTGACMIALGYNYAGLFCNSEKLRDKLIENSGYFGESLWEMPFDKSIEEGLKGAYSDIVNSTKQRYGGAIEAAEFLKYFVNEGVEWAHIDIAGVAEDKKIPSKSNQPYSSGFGVSTILNFFKNDIMDAWYN